MLTPLTSVRLVTAVSHGRAPMTGLSFSSPSINATISFTTLSENEREYIKLLQFMLSNFERDHFNSKLQNQSQLKLRNITKTFLKTNIYLQTSSPNI